MEIAELKVTLLNTDVISTSSKNLCAHFTVDRPESKADHIRMTGIDGSDIGYDYYEYANGQLTYGGHIDTKKTSDNEYSNINTRDGWYYWDKTSGKYVICESEYQSSTMHDQN